MLRQHIVLYSFGRLTGRSGHVPLRQSATCSGSITRRTWPLEEVLGITRFEEKERRREGGKERGRDILASSTLHSENWEITLQGVDI
jgi:hypothetical protein